MHYRLRVPSVAYIGSNRGREVLYQGNGLVFEVDRRLNVDLAVSGEVILMEIFKVKEH